MQEVPDSTELGFCSQFEASEIQQWVILEGVEDEGEAEVEMTEEF